MPSGIPTHSGIPMPSGTPEKNERQQSTGTKKDKNQQSTACTWISPIRKETKQKQKSSVTRVSQHKNNNQPTWANNTSYGMPSPSEKHGSWSWQDVVPFLTIRWEKNKTINS